MPNIENRACQQNYFNLLTDDTNDDDLNLALINRIFDNLDGDSISAYHDISSYNTLLKEHHESLLLLHLNFRSMSKNLNVFEALMNSFLRFPDVIAISQSWLKSKNSQFYNLEGYTSYHVTRESKKGGGASLLISSSIDSELVNEFSFISNDIEICTVKIKFNCTLSKTTKKFVISAIYRPQSKHKNRALKYCYLGAVGRNLVV